MTPIIDGFRRLEAPEETDLEDSHTDNRSDTTDRSRKTSKTESNDLSSLRNLSTNGLMMFDPLVINAAASTSNENRQIPDHDLVTSLNEQVTEIADRLSSIAASDVLEQKHSFSTNDVPTLISTDDPEFTGPRNEQLSCMPSTSHGYLIPNAISHEPVVLSSLSHNNSAVFNPEGEQINLNNAVLNTELSLIIPENIDADNTNISLSIANANLSSLLLTNEEYRENFVNNNEEDNTSFHSAKMTIKQECIEDDKVKFMVGHDSDNESPVDSGVSTENTSLDRSPDTDQKENFIDTNRVIKEDKTIETNTIENYEVNINYTEENTQKNEASSSINRVSSDEESSSETPDINLEARKVLQDWGMPMPENAEFKTIDDVISELRKHRLEKAGLVDDNNTSNNVTSSSSSSSRKCKDIRRKSTSKTKRKKSKMWSPGIVILDSRSQNQNPLRLNLDHFVDGR